ncbi:MAG: 4Fe-4S binding protein [Elusimicrobiota bacterium]
MLFEVLGSIFRKPATVLYPAEKTVKPEKLRGKIVFIADKCIGCMLCMKDCPANAIFINKVGDKMFDCEMHLDRCVYCAQCVDSCMKKALESTPEFELAQIDKRKFTVRYENKTPLQPAPSKEPEKPA